mmetsp:Transcript_54270/g.173986  ORF Transcript_54270/g.173986 Transcript_54270/m.173986 type:complete len:233 (-) Transcript_54270:20-718(-)
MADHMLLCRYRTDILRRTGATPETDYEAVLWYNTPQSKACSGKRQEVRIGMSSASRAVAAWPGKASASAHARLSLILSSLFCLHSSTKRITSLLTLFTSTMRSPAFTQRSGLLWFHAPTNPPLMYSINSVAPSWWSTSMPSLPPCDLSSVMQYSSRSGGSIPLADDFALPPAGSRKGRLAVPGGGSFLMVMSFCSNSQPSDWQQHLDVASPMPPPRRGSQRALCQPPRGKAL